MIVLLILEVREHLTSMQLDEKSRDAALSTVTAQFTEVWNSGNLDLIPELYSEDFIGHFPGGAILGQEGIRDVVADHRRAFPDWTEQVEDVVFEGDKIAVRFSSSGTNRGPNRGKPPTDRFVQISEMAIYRIVAGKIAEQWVLPDTHSLLHQLYGDVPPDI